jgi:hypothetical protein
MNFKPLLLLVMLLGQIANAQFKFEKETRISSSQLPKVVVELLPLITHGAKRVRYYHEFDGKNDSFEVKLKKYGNHFSIEFSQTGILEDIEMLIPKSELPVSVLQVIDSQFQRYKLTRIQEQFVHPNEADPIKTIQEVFKKVVKPTAYEIIVHGKTKTGFKQRELLIDPKGKLLKKRNIIPYNNDHIMY